MIDFEHQKVSISGQTIPVMEDNLQIDSIESFIIYCARVSNPESQVANLNNQGLMKYLIRNAHWSPFEMGSITMRIETTRDIARQMLRHRSFSFQEFSQRYAAVSDFIEHRQTRMQDTTNRQNSIPCASNADIFWWNDRQKEVIKVASENYYAALDRGIAKEQARVLLPEGLTSSTLFMAGTVRSWIHYADLRCANGTQLEHMDIANKVKTCLLEELPSLGEYFDEQQKDTS